MTGPQQPPSVKRKASAEIVAEHQFSLPTFGPGEWEVLMMPTKVSPFVYRVTRDLIGTISTSCISSPLMSRLLSLETQGPLNALAKECYRVNTEKHDSVPLVPEQVGHHYRSRACAAWQRQTHRLHGHKKRSLNGAGVS